MPFKAFFNFSTEYVSFIIKNKWTAFKVGISINFHFFKPDPDRQAQDQEADLDLKAWPTNEDPTGPGRATSVVDPDPVRLGSGIFEPASEAEPNMAF
jgi:hypothetical protein